jgi:hypothetical protein
MSGCCNGVEPSDSRKSGPSDRLNECPFHKIRSVLWGELLSKVEVTLCLIG